MIKDKVLAYLERNNLYNKNLTVTIEALHKGINSSKISRKKISDAIGELTIEGILNIQGGVVRSNSSMLKGVYYAGKNGTGKIVTTESGKKVEYFVPAKNSNSAMDKSVVTFIKKELKEETIATITKVVDTDNNKLLGTVVVKEGLLKFVPDDERYNKYPIDLVQNEFAAKALSQKCFVYVKNPRQIEQHQRIDVEIINDSQIVGDINSFQANLTALVLDEGIKTDFPESVVAEALKAPKFVTEEEKALYKDFTNVGFITIDPATTKDRDDAVHGERLYINGKHVGYLVTEATALVSHYIKPGMSSYKEATLRRTSHYPAGTVYPMLHPLFSNNICSLNENETRLAMVTQMVIDLEGRIRAYDVNRGFINSRKQFSYEEASDIYHNVPEALDKFAEHKEQIDVLYEIRDAFAIDAKKRGALELNTDQPTIVRNKENNDVIDFRNDKGVDSHNVIAYIMIASNSVKGDIFAKTGVNALYRVHEEPKEDKFDTMIAKLMQLGIDYDGEPDNKTYQRLIELTNDHYQSNILNSIIVRSMPRAKYDTDAGIGHFALGRLSQSLYTHVNSNPKPINEYLEDILVTNPNKNIKINFPYAHSTSPIRRVADLTGQLTMGKILEIRDNYKTAKKFEDNIWTSQIVSALAIEKRKDLQYLERENELHNLAVDINLTNECADRLEQKANALASAKYMEKHLGEVKKGYVSSLYENEVTVLLNDSNDPEHSNIIEVTVPVEEFGIGKNVHVSADYTRIISNADSAKFITLGDDVTLKVMSTDLNTRKVYGSTDLTKELNIESETQDTLTLKR